ncbi:hypothetical protein N1851_007097 [Merluccius polli]|uniref:DDE Tnp4 domain-containing protein n=1 Tax=Merluccius polli TaxID=89951 RepID=A0AA47N398_MERPO|nr:hypothetical protein N1851_007097 [Merluccius polli]
MLIIYSQHRPFNLRARAQTWSNYKHHNTLKALIGITPYGSISFISKMWGGRISDKEISGFLIGDDLARLGAILVMPPLLKGRKQLPGLDVGRVRQLSALRSHVERAIEISAIGERFLFCYTEERMVAATAMDTYGGPAQGVLGVHLW